MTRFPIMLPATLAAALGAGTAAAQEAFSGVAVPDGELVWHDCPYPVPDEPMRCGTLHVPEDYDRPEGPRIALPVAVLPATGGAPAPDHILYLNGGPGHSATSWLGVMARIGAPRADRDLVVLEQRGNGAAEPALICQENEEVRACHDRLLAQGIDLARYGTLDAARDAEALRRALGGPQVNLYGISYGTTLALQVLRLFPEGVRSVVLDSPSAPDTDIAVADVTSQLDGLSRLFAACTADLGCARRFPGVRQAFLASVERLDAEPLPLRAEPLRALLGPELTGAALVGVAARVMQNRVLLPRTPALLDALGRGDDEAVLRLLDGAIPEPPPGFPAERATALGVTLSVYCAELPFSRFGREPLTTQEAWPEAVVAALTPDYWTSCVAGDWPVPPVDPVLLTQVQSDVPTLILLGEFDPISSRAEAGRAAAGLSNARIVTIPGATHGMTEVDPCAQGLMGAFLASPDGLLDTGCAEPGQELTFE